MNNMRKNITEKELRSIIKFTKSRSPFNRRKIYSKILNDIKKGNSSNKNHLIKIVIDELKKI
jgi:hypothetical protein